MTKQHIRTADRNGMAVFSRTITLTHTHTHALAQTKNKNLISTKATVTSSLLGQTPLLSFTIAVDERAFRVPAAPSPFPLFECLNPNPLFATRGTEVRVRSCEVSR